MNQNQRALVKHQYIIQLAIRTSKLGLWVQMCQYSQHILEIVYNVCEKSKLGLGKAFRMSQCCQQYSKNSLRVQCLEPPKELGLITCNLVKYSNKHLFHIHIKV